MGVNDAEIFFGKVMHGRLFPKRNNFTYNIYYLALPLQKLKALPIAYNKFSALSFHDSDHGKYDGSDLNKWARSILKKFKLDKANGEIKLICMPRIFGYVFNPVSFWLCHDKKGGLRAVLCEVHNTFGEKHTYVCAHKNQNVIKKDDTLIGQKLFHVSPFLEREGHYTFKFDTFANKFHVWIDFFDINNKKQLVTSLIGTLEPLNKKTLRKAFWGHPLVTFKAITLIHWQAVKLIFKGIKYIPKPKQKKTRVSETEKLTKL